jgi:hypothetical protein
VIFIAIAKSLGDETIDVDLVMITDAGRKALEEG